MNWLSVVNLEFPHLGAKFGVARVCLIFGCPRGGGDQGTDEGLQGGGREEHPSVYASSICSVPDNALWNSFLKWLLLY